MGKEGYLDPKYCDVDVEVGKNYEQTYAQYEQLGKAIPNYAISLIRQMYTQQYTREAKRHYNNVSPDINMKIDRLQRLTEIKLLNYVMRLKSQDDGLTLTFINGKPDEKTATFFSIENSDGKQINKARTNALVLPRTLYKKYRNGIIHFTVFGDGREIVAAKQKGAKESVLINTI